MSKEKENKYFDVEDPLAGLGFNDEDSEETIEELDAEPEALEDEFDELEEEFETEPKITLAERLAPIKEKVSDVMAPAVKAASVKLPVKKAAIIIGSVAVAAIAIAILIFSLYSSAAYTSGKTVAQWAKEWNEISFSDTCRYTLYSTYPGTAKLETMLISDTDHVYLTDDDIAALRKGDSISLFNDTAKLSVDTYRNEFKSATMSIDYENFCDSFFGEDYKFDSTTYAPEYFEDSTIRVLSFLSVFMNPLNDKLNDQDELLTAAIDLYLANGSAYNYNGSNIMDFGDYTLKLHYDEEDYLVVTSNSDISLSDMTASDISASVETHLIINITYEYNKAGEKKHAADWSWWNELFPKKEDKQSDIYDNADKLDNVVSNADTSASDISKSDA